MKTAAFFDFDKTLLAVDSAEIGLFHLWREGVLSTFLLGKIIVMNELFKRHLVKAEQIMSVILQLYRGKRLVEFEEGASDFYHKHLKPLISTVVLREVEAHREQGHVLVLLSASVRYMLRHVVEDLGFDFLLCTDLEQDSQGILTGRPEGLVCAGREKANSALRLAAQENIDLSLSFAYGDHYSDRYILQAVGNPVAVSPDRKLAEFAKRHNWRMIYHEK